MAISNYSALISEVKRNKDKFYIIHYSCESLNDENSGLVPRITSIAILHYSTKKIDGFSTHLTAEELGVDRKYVFYKKDEIEKKLLEDFYKFIKEKEDIYWIHWNMKSPTYGFEHIESRYKILTGRDDKIAAADKKISLSDILWDKYGEYAKHPRIESLMKINKRKDRNFVPGKKEPKLFKKGKFMKIHTSTISKVEFFLFVIEQLIKDELKTKSKRWVWIDKFFKSRIFNGIMLVAALLGIFYFFYDFIPFILSLL